MGTATAGDGLTILEGLEAIRRRPSMYIGGDAPIDQMHRLVWAVVKEAIENPAGARPSTVEVILHPDNCVAVTDDGPGIPIDAIGEPVKRPRFDVMMLTLSIGVHDPEKWGQLVRIGPILNALTERLRVYTVRDGVHCGASFSRGMYLALLAGRPARRGAGTRLVFRPDPILFGATAIVPERLDGMLAPLRVQHPAVAISLRIVDEAADWS